MTRPRSLVLDVSNLSMHFTKFVRTGIQEVVYRTLLSAARLRAEFPQARITLLPQLPRHMGSATLVPYGDLPRFILEEVERALGMASADVWGFDLAAEGYRLSDQRLLEILSGADQLHIQGLVNTGPLMEALAARGRRPSLSMTVYDLVPVLYPEYCDDGIARWYERDYLPSLGSHVEHAVCISRHTALDLLAHPVTSRIPRVTVLPLPFELADAGDSAGEVPRELGLVPGDYLVSLGSLEPRKNFEALLEGFEHYRSMNAASTLRLALVGGTGWKNDATEARIRSSPFARDIIRTGYLDDARLAAVLKRATALAMLSVYEGYGLPIAQAYSLGVPAITTLGSSLPEACRAHGIFVTPHDPCSVSAGIAAAARGELRVEAGASPREWTWENYARRLLGAILAAGQAGAA